ncbi:MAG: GNAT family N-acetyltransferase [Bellilinea sp.]
MTEPNLSINWQPLNAIPGLTFRYFAGEPDYPIRLDITNACKELNGIEWVMTLEDIKNEEKWTANYDIRKQLIYVELDGAPIGYFGYSWAATPDGGFIFSPFGNLLQNFWGRGIASLMLRFAEEKCREVAAALPPEKDKRFRVWKKKKAVNFIQFMQAHGYQIERYFFSMSRPIDLPLGEHPLPPGVEIRPVEPSQYRAIWNADQEAFRDHWGYTEPAEDMFVAWQNDRLFQPRHYKVAWEGGQVCGMVLNFLDPQENETYRRKRGYTEGISVRRPWRGKGLAKALIAESIRMFREIGMEETYLGVDADNTSGALLLYRSMGYTVEEDQTSYMLYKML